MDENAQDAADYVEQIGLQKALAMIIDSPSKLARQWELEVIEKCVKPINALTVSGGGLQLKKAKTNWMLTAPDSAMKQRARRAIEASLSFAGFIPAAAEVKVALESAYASADLVPVVGDIVYMAQFHYLVAPSTTPGGVAVTENDLCRISFSVDGQDHMALQVGPARLL